MTDDERRDIRIAVAAMKKFLAANWTRQKTEKKVTGRRRRLYADMIGELRAVAARFMIRHYDRVHDYVTEKRAQGKWNEENFAKWVFGWK